MTFSRFKIKVVLPPQLTNSQKQNDAKHGQYSWYDHAKHHSELPGGLVPGPSTVSARLEPAVFRHIFRTRTGAWCESVM